MKKIFRTFAFATVAIAVFAACNKEIENATPAGEQEQVFTFAIGNNSGETRSILGSDENGRFVQFDDDDNVNYSGVGCIAPNAQGYSKVEPASGDTPVTFSIYTKGVVEGNKITVWYPYRSKQEDATSVELVIPDEQLHKVGNAFDMKAMPMVTKQITVTAEMVTATTGSYTPVATINFANMGSLINFKVFSSSQTYAGEKVKSITFNAKNAEGNAEANIGGTFTKNLATIDPDNEETMAISSFTSGVSSIVTKPYADAAIGTTKDSALDLYMVIAPGNYSGTIVVKTDEAEYTYTLTAKAFARSGIKAFGLDLNSSNAVRNVKPESFTITTSDVPFSGTGYHSYPSVEIEEAYFSFTDVMKSGTTNFQMKASSGAIRNTTELGKRIESISFSSVTNSVIVKAGSTSANLSSDNVTVSDGTYSFADGCKFFEISTGAQYAIIGPITVNYYPGQPIVWSLSNIAITTNPDKVVYYAGESFETDGMIVMAHYVDANDPTHVQDVVITNYEYAPSGALSTADNKITITYENQTVEVSITVKPAPVWVLSGLEIENAPSQTDYYVGDFFNPAGLVVNGIYVDTNESTHTKIETINNSELAFTPSLTTPLAVTDNKVTITYGGKSVDQTISVSEGGFSLYLTFPDDNSVYNGLTSNQYVSTWTAESGSYSWSISNFNNNNWSGGWKWIKCGRKNNASVATIITDAAISKAIKTVKITIDDLTASKINSIKLYSSSNKTTWTEEGSFTKAQGEQSVTIANPAESKYYKLEFDCASGSSNGLLTLSKVVYTTE